MKLNKISHIHIVVNWGPGKPYRNFYVCAGLDPSMDKSLPDKSLLFNTIFKVFSICIHLIIGLRIQIYKWNYKTPNRNNPKRRVESFQIGFFEN
jgi:hypothetical protein